MLKLPKFDRVTEILDQIQKDFQTSSENIGKIRGLLEEKPEPEINSYEDAFEALNPRFFITSRNQLDKAQGNNLNYDQYNQNNHTSKESCIDTQKYIKRKLIAEALGARLFVYGEENYTIAKWQIKVAVTCFRTDETIGCNYFPTELQAQKYLDICLKEGLL